MSEMALPHYKRIRQTLSGKSNQSCCTLPTHPDNESIRKLLSSLLGQTKTATVCCKKLVGGSSE